MSNARSPVPDGLPGATPLEHYEAVRWHDGALWLLDQTRLPWSIEYLRIADLEGACEAIRSLRVRGAPAIGIAAAYSLAAIAGSLGPSAGLDAALAEVERAAEALA